MGLLASRLAGGESLAEQSLDSVARQIRPPSPPPGRGPADRPADGPATGPLEPELRVLERFGVLEEAVRQRLVAELIASVQVDAPEAPEAPEASDALALQGPEVDPNLNDLRLKLWIEGHYEPLLQAWALRHSRDLETWIYVCLRVQEESMASELYLQVIDDGGDLSVLVDRHGLGEERWTRGVVGPVRAAQVAPELRECLEGAAVGQILAPRQVHDDWLILQLLHRFPADPEDGWREEVLWEMFQRDLDAMVARVLRRLREGPISLESAVETCSWQPSESQDLPLLPGMGS